METTTRPIGFSIGLIACAIIVAELALIRIFDVIWYTNMSYMVITLAMLAFGSAGVVVGIIGVQRFPPKSILVLGVLFACSLFLIQPIVDSLDFKLFAKQNMWRAGAHFLVVYLILSLPFFLGSMILTIVFSKYVQNLNVLYSFDLIGASIGCVIIVAAVSLVGPGGLLIWASAMILVAICFWVQNYVTKILFLALGFSLIGWTFLDVERFEFSAQINKRNFIYAQASGRHEVGRWDAVSKIDIFNMGGYKWVSYDGGTQTSNYVPFDGDFEKVNADSKINYLPHFNTPMVLVSHRLKEKTNQNVLIIGAAGGQETKAALAYGAQSVDAIEMVGAVIDLAKNEYDEYLGGIYNHPKVNAVRAEGRSYLRSMNKKYDIIQIFSNHTSSSMGSGTGALSTTYLQTKEAYIEYLTHLSDDGILHINHHIYPRMLATAALAWKELGWTDFEKHVVVYESKSAADNLPTFLIKKSPWEAEQVDKIDHFLPNKTRVIDPIDSNQNYLPSEFFSGVLPEEMIDDTLYHVEPTTDDKPYFNYLRKHFRTIEADQSKYTNLSVTALLNKQFRNNIPLDSVHLFVTSIAALFFALCFVGALLLSRASKTVTDSKSKLIIYFASLGAGFIIFELVFIQVFMKLIGFPAYTYASVVFGFLFGAGIGSSRSRLYRDKLTIPFLCIIAYVILFVYLHQFIFALFLSYPILIRVIVSLLLIFPLAYYLGMAFPLGASVFERKDIDIIPWAWAFNGLFTVIGSIISVVASLYIGFKLTLLIGVCIYLIALLVLHLQKRIQLLSQGV